MRITTKFLGSSAVLVGLTLLLPTASYVINQQKAQALDERYRQTQQMVSAVAQLERSLQSQITTLGLLSVLNPQINQNAEEWATFRRSRMDFFDTLRSLEAVFLEEDPLPLLKVQSIRQRHRYLDDLAARLQTQRTSPQDAQGIARSLRLFEETIDTYVVELLATADKQLAQQIEQEQVFQKQVLLLGAINLVAILLLLVAQFCYLLRPMLKAIRVLEAGANQVGQAERDVTDMPRIHLRTGDELQALADAFNHMSDHLSSVYQELEQRVAARTASLHKANQTLTSEVCDRVEAEASLTQALEELKRTQIQLLQTEKMSSLGQLVAGVAHEINNPVSFIEGNLQPAQEYVDSLLLLLRKYKAECPEASRELSAAIEDADVDFIREDFPRLLASMKNGTDRITTIVRSLRTFSHLDESETKVSDLHDDLDSVLLLLSSQLNGTGQSGVSAPITVIRNYGDLPKVHCYPSQLNQVFMGLITNAIEAIHSRFDSRLENRLESRLASPGNSFDASQTSLPAVLTLTTESFPTFVRIQIADSGVGMSETVKQHIFDPFFTTKPVGSGTGLGLSMSYQIVVNNHQGKLTCRSAPNKGTTFTIEIPLGLKLQNLPDLSPHTPLSALASAT